MKKYSIFLLLMVIAILPVKAITADQILGNAASVFTKAGSVSATYTISSGSSGKVSGSIKVEGKKFRIQTPAATVCYNGTNQWEYVAKNKQCTLTSPTYQETAQINPYAILSTYKNSYKIASVKSNISGTYAIRLTPISSNSALAKATIYIKSSDWQPVRLDILDKNNVTTTIIITGITLGQKFTDSTFTFDKKNYPGVELIDLR